MDPDLIRRAGAGDDQSREELFRLVHARVRAYLNRVTLDQDRAADWAQDTVVSVLQSLPTLRDPDRFWPWVFTIASNRARQLLRQQSRRRTIPMSTLSDSELAQATAGNCDAPAGLLREELAERVRSAMADLDCRYRMVLALRFYEDLPYREIARAIGCSEVVARAVFFRAKRAMVGRLKRLGVAEGALVAALVAFGESTLAPSASAATLTISTAAVTQSAIAGLLPVRAWAGIAAVLALLILASAYLMHSDGPAKPAAGPAQYVRFIEQSMVAASEDLHFSGTRSKGAYEQWLKFPDGVAGPVLTRMQRWDPYQKEKLCWWVQNEEGSFYVHGGKRVIYIENAHFFRSNLSTRVLPTDPEPFCEFVRQTDRGEPLTGITWVRDPGTGFMARRTDTRFPELGPFETVYDYAAQKDELFQSPRGMPAHDERDNMHRRGWTYFRIAGTLGGRKVEGTGRLPFLYRELKSHGPWIKLTCDGQLVAGDTGARACILVSGEPARSLPGGSLFQGLSRPWSGFHAIDTIRRDAAGERLRYDIALVDDRKRAEISVANDREDVWRIATYSVDMDGDLLERVEFREGQSGLFEESVGELSFTYLDDVTGVANEFEIPDLPSAETQEAGPGILWPMRLAAKRRADDASIATEARRPVR